MNTKTLNITALPESLRKSFFLGYDTLALSSGSAVFLSNKGDSARSHAYSEVRLGKRTNLRLSPLNLREYGGSVQRQGKKPGIVTVRKVNTKGRIGDESLQRVLQVQVSNPAIPYLKINGESSSVVEQTCDKRSLVRIQPLSLFKSIVLNSSPYAYLKRSMEKLTTTTKIPALSNLTTGNLDKQQNTNPLKMRQPIKETDSYLLQDVNIVDTFQSESGINIYKKQCRRNYSI